MIHTGVIVLNLEKALTNSENIRGQLVEMNRILMVAVQQVKDQMIQAKQVDLGPFIDILEDAEEQVKVIATKDGTNASNY